MMRMLVKLKPLFYLIPVLVLILSTFFSFSHGQTVNGNLPMNSIRGGNMAMPANLDDIPMTGKDGNMPMPTQGNDGTTTMPVQVEDGNVQNPLDGTIPMPLQDGSVPIPLKDGSFQTPFQADLSGMVGSMEEKMAKAKLGNGTLIVLAEKQTRRKDPLDHFHYYKGGWNITNQHYHASVAFSSFPFLVTAVVWFAVFGVFMLCACYFCCGKNNNSYGYSPLSYALCLTLLILFTLVAIAGCGIMYHGEARFLKTVNVAANYIVHQGEKISKGLLSVYVYLASAKTISMDSNTFLPQELVSQIDRVTSELDANKDFPNIQSKLVADSLFEVLETANTVLICITVTMLLVAVLGFLFSVIGWQTWVYTFVVIAWIITTLAFVLCGVFLVFHNLMADTCIAVDEWVQNPMAGSAIKELLPCVDSEYGKNVTNATKLVSKGINDLMNQQISLVANANNLPPIAVPLYYNQSGPLLPIICDPYVAEKANQHCGKGQVALSKAIQEWNKHVCQASAAGICRTQGRLTPSMYKRMSAAVNVSYALYSYGPFLASLVDCSLIRVILNDMHKLHCPGLRKFSQRVYIGLVIATVSVVFCSINWVFYGRESRHRKYTKLIVDKVPDETPVLKE